MSKTAAEIIAEINAKNAAASKMKGVAQKLDVTPAPAASSKQAPVLSKPDFSSSPPSSIPAKSDADSKQPPGLSSKFGASSKKPSPSVSAKPEVMSTPTNYRTNQFHLFDRDFTIAGMQGAHNTGNPGATLRYLHEHDHRAVLIGLHEKNFTEIATKNGLEYHWIPIPDFSDEVSDETYDSIYEAVKQAVEAGKQVTIHCGSGDGRTGTALASLKLRELLEQSAQHDPSILDDKPEKSATVLIKGIVEYPCTPFVKEAIEKIRTERVPISDLKAGRRSVESHDDIDILIGYEAHLRAAIKKELSAREDRTL